MKPLIQSLAICAVLLLALSFIFKEAISQRIIESECTDFEFYHIKLKICNDDAKQLIQAEKDSISYVVSQMEADNNELVAVNSELEASLKKCASTAKVKATIQRSELSKMQNKLLKSRIELYKISPVIKGF